MQVGDAFGCCAARAKDVQLTRTLRLAADEDDRTVGGEHGIVDAHAPDVDARNAELHAKPGSMGPAPGTVILVFVFLAAFGVYFFVNWPILSCLWRIG